MATKSSITFTVRGQSQPVGVGGTRGAAAAPLPDGGC